MLALFLIYLPQLTFENMGIAFEQTANFSENQKYETSINTSPLRTYTFQASNKFSLEIRKKKLYVLDNFIVVI